MQVRSLDGEDPLGKKWQPTPAFFPGKSQARQMSLAGYSPWGCKESDVTEATQHDIYTCMGFPGGASGKELTC